VVLGGDHGGGRVPTSSQGLRTAAGDARAAPTNLTATGGGWAGGGFELEWRQVGSTSLQPDRSTTSTGGPYTTIAIPTTTSLTRGTGVTKRYDVTTTWSLAVNTAGESANSAGDGDTAAAAGTAIFW